jgi:hypothetical protein
VRRRALAGADEAVLVAIACSPVPERHDPWTVRMLQAKLMEMSMGVDVPKKIDVGYVGLAGFEPATDRL